MIETPATGRKSRRTGHFAATKAGPQGKLVGMPLVGKPGERPDEQLLEKLQQQLGVRFRDPEVLVRAVTHASWANENPVRVDGAPTQNNERDEFLGDAVLDLATSHLIMERFPISNEGELSRLRAALVNERRLADVARRIGLGDFLLLGKGEEMSGGREKESLLADVLEAIVGAIYQEAGYPAALEFLAGHLVPDLEELGAPGFDRDFKTRLQELAQSRLKATPRYALVREVGPDHEKVFEVNLLIGGKVHGTGSGRSKKEAEQAAAKDALARLDGEAEAARGGNGADGNANGEGGGAEPAAGKDPPGGPAGKPAEDVR